MAKNTSRQRREFSFDFLLGEARKQCPKCGESKLLSDFSSRSTQRHAPCSYCRLCQREYCKQHYKAMRNIHNSRRYQRQAESRKTILQRIRDYKRNKCCVDCGETDPIVLEFDHVRGAKLGDIGRMTYTSTWHLIELEIMKCDLRCANCHRRKTARQRGWKIRAYLAEM